jgi:glycosyltransferase involved in cell wall biosynthesis
MMDMNQRINAYTGRKFAVVSHVLPPLPSGQSILLERLLRDVEPDSYCLINSGKVNPSAGALPGKSHQLRLPLRIPVLYIPLISWPPLILNAIWGILDRARQIAKIVRSENCDLLIGCTGDLYDLPATWLASRWTGRPFIAYIIDDYIFQWTGFHRRMAAWLEPKFVNSASKVFVLNEFVRNFYNKRYGIHPDVIHNPVRLPDLDQPDLFVAGSDPSMVKIVYTGSIYHAHFDAFKNLVDVLNDGDWRRVQLHIYTSQPKDLLEQQGITGPAVVFHKHIPQEEVFKVLRQSDILFLPLAFHSTIPEVIQTSAPFKTSEYLAVCKPILVHAPADSFLSWYFRQNNCGMVVDHNDRQLLKESLDRLLVDETLRQSLAVAARQQAATDFEINAIKRKVISLLNQVGTGDRS